MSQVQVFQTSTGDLERGLGYQHVVQEIGSNVEDPVQWGLFDES